MTDPVQPESVQPAPKPLTCHLGATREDWQWAARFVGEDILPAVTDNTRPRAPNSKLQVKGHEHCNKTPSSYSNRGEIHGFRDWALKRATPDEIRRWASEPYHNILINTRRIQALDIDIPDFEVAERIQQQVFAILGFDKMPLRYRQTVGKRTIFFETTGDHDFIHSVVNVEGYGIVEFLPQGKQSVLFGVHPDGDRYFIRDHEDGFPKIDIALVKAMWDMLRSTLHPKAGSIERTERQRRNKFVLQGHVAAIDPVVPFLYANGLVVDEEDPQKINVKCPWERMHKTDTGPTSTSWLCAGSGGRATGAFSCLHTSCQPPDNEQNRTRRFLQHIGYFEYEAQNTFEGEEAPPAPPVPALAQVIQAAVQVQAQSTMTLGLMRDSKGNIEKRVSNLNEIVRASPDVFEFRFDDFKQLSYARIGSSTIWEEVTDLTIGHVREIVERRYRLSFGVEDVSRAVDAAANMHKYDSAMQWIEQVKAQWDGQPRIGRFATDILRAAPSPYAQELSFYLWVAMVGRILSPGVKADISPILISPNQGTGKSSLVQALAPFAEWYAALDLSAKDADIFRLLRGKASIELPELKGLTTRDSDNLKAFLTQPVDSWIPKYREREIRVPRRCLFIGTDNRLRMLQDPTGNRRWAPLRVAITSRFVDWPSFVNDRDQYWAEAAHALAKEPTVLAGVEYHASKLRSLAGPFIADATVTDVWHRPVREFMERQPFGTPITIQAIAAGIGIPQTLEQRANVSRLRTVMTMLGIKEIDTDVWLAPGQGL